MEHDLEQRLTQLEQKIDATYTAANKTRKYMFWTFVISVVVIVLPLIGLIFVIPQFLGVLDIYKML